MRRFLIAFVAALVVMGVLDAVWLGMITKDFYPAQIGHLMAPTVQVPAAVLFYLLYVAGLVVFAVQPALGSAAGGRALRLGALFGLVAYGTYDLTNLATLRDWPLLVTVIDMAWGSLISACTAWASHRITRAITARLAA